MALYIAAMKEGGTILGVGDTQERALEGAYSFYVPGLDDEPFVWEADQALADHVHPIATQIRPNWHLDNGVARIMP